MQSNHAKVIVMKSSAVASISTSISDFIELNRTFHELSKEYSATDDEAINHASYTGKQFNWSNLIEEYRLIILSEAGSGKTYEIRSVTHKLREQGKPAFFLRLENIPTDFKDAFEIGTYAEFEAWLESVEDGWLLLDSLDEARLRHPGDFELAIRKLSSQIRAAYDRAHIIITGRATAWRPKTDLAYCCAHLPCTAAAVTTKRVPYSEETVPDSTVQTETMQQAGSPPVFKIVTMTDLTHAQIEVFLKFRGIIDRKAFLESVERADAWSFTARPQDLEELVEFWTNKGLIGTRLEIIQNSITRRLTERDQNRATAQPLSPDRARLGSKLLAAATTLAKDPIIKVPDGAAISKGLSVNSVLPDWDNKAQSILLSRPIFDEAIYGFVRFHHRSVREYLTAEWFADLLKRETSRRMVESLFFNNKYGVDIVAPTLKPVLPWLVLLDDKIRDRLLKFAPEIIFEEGDPSRLPLDIRRQILKDVCEEIAGGTANRSIYDRAAVQRFATADLTDDVRELIQKYSSNDDLMPFLLRMVWIGKLEGALPHALNIALTPTAHQYTRLSAFRAINAIGSSKNQEIVRQSFQAEPADLNRDLLAELLETVPSSEQNLQWLLACLKKCEPKERYSYDHLMEAMDDFVDHTDILLLPQLIAGLNKLLSLPPVIDCQFCEISQQFDWLMASACKACERLIMAHHPDSLKPDALSILHKCGTFYLYRRDILPEVKADFTKLVPAWAELNRALFWLAVQKSREDRVKNQKIRLIDFGQATVLKSFWRFVATDFEYVTSQIYSQPFQDDKLVALSLAFNLYVSAKRPRAWRMRLKKLVADNNELSERLNFYLKPPAQSRDSRQFKKLERKRMRRAEADQIKRNKYHADWKNYFHENFDEVRNVLRLYPGTLTNPLRYLLDQARDKDVAKNRWTAYNWNTLIPEFGDQVARFFRDSAVSFWRNHTPQLRSEGAPLDRTTYAVIFGLTGLEIEAHETPNWPANLSDADAERTCRYASFEMNGFPMWFPKLFDSHPKVVCDFLVREIQFELSIETPEKGTHYILDDVSCSGSWAWDQIAPTIYDLLKNFEPTNLSNLDRLLRILQGSSFPDSLVGDLASQKCFALEDLRHLAQWFAVWIGVAPNSAISALREKFTAIIDTKSQTEFAMSLILNLCGRYNTKEPRSRQAFRTPDHLKSLYLLMLDYIRPDEDTKRPDTGVYSTGLRDDAQNSRDHLLTLLSQIPGKESFMALMDIAERHPDRSMRPWIIQRATTRAELDGDIQPWSPAQVCDFHRTLNRTPSNHQELADLAVFRLMDLKDDLEEGDNSIASIVKSVEDETELRNFIGRELREKASGRYSIPQEEELADAKRTDLRFLGVGFDGPVPVELKLADNWTGPQLFERLENQLCGDYLRDNRSRRGVFLIVCRGEKHGWDLPNLDIRVDFAGLISALQAHWVRIAPNFLNIDDITVIGIDLLKRS